MRFSNLHTHSTFSDGDFSPEKMLQRAIAENFVSYGLSDHSDTPCDQSYCMKKAQYAEYLAVCRELKEKYADKIEFYCGLEKDFFSEIDYENFDYTIGSVHYVKCGNDFYAVDDRQSQANFIAKEGRGDPLELAKRYYANVAEHALKGKFNIQGHFDVIAKYGAFDDENEAYRKVALEALDVVLENGKLIEMNTGAIFRGNRTHPYPHEFFMRRIREKGGRMVINTDAHHVDAVNFFYPQALALCKQYGFSSVWQLRGGAFREIPIE